MLNNPWTNFVRVYILPSKVEHVKCIYPLWHFEQKSLIVVLVQWQNLMTISTCCGQRIWFCPLIFRNIITISVTARIDEAELQDGVGKKMITNIEWNCYALLTYYTCDNVIKVITDEANRWMNSEVPWMGAVKELNNLGDMIITIVHKHKFPQNQCPCTMNYSTTKSDQNLHIT